MLLHMVIGVSKIWIMAGNLRQRPYEESHIHSWSCYRHFKLLADFDNIWLMGAQT